MVFDVDIKPVYASLRIERKEVYMHLHFIAHRFNTKLQGVIIIMLLLAGCSQISVETYKDLTPRLVPEAFFDGHLSAHGVVKDRSGKVIRSFNAEIDASWQDGVGVLDERFVFDDGEHQRRRWELLPQPDGTYHATANDTVGTGIMSVAGNSVFLDYVLQIQYKGRALDIVVDDRMYLINDTTLVNESKMKKWGLHVGEVLLVIIKH